MTENMNLATNYIYAAVAATIDGHGHGGSGGGGHGGGCHHGWCGNHCCNHAGEAAEAELANTESTTTSEGNSKLAEFYFTYYSPSLRLK